MKNSEKLLYSYLLETEKVTPAYVTLLNEEVKSEGVATIAKSILAGINERLSNIDTTPIDRSKGEIRQLKELEYVQVALETIEQLVEKNKTIPVDPKVKDFYSTITKAILYLNQYSQQFKEAYRLKKTVLILQYQSVVLGIVSAVDYLCAKLLDVRSGAEAVLKKSGQLEEIAPIKTLKSFIGSMERNELKIINKDVDMIREFYNEIPSEKMGAILEANDIISVVLDGVKNLYSNLDQGGKTTALIYKAAGVIVALMSVRQIFYTISRSRYKVQELFDTLKGFANVSLGKGGPITKLVQFGSRFVADIEENSKIVDRDINHEDKEISIQVKEVSHSNPADIIDRKADRDEPVTLKLKQPVERQDNDPIMDF